MGDYNLYGLNPRDFQHLIQAIARKHIAPGVSAFGDGKDGARDLTFTGKMNFPSSAGQWDGYMILGCKFLQRPTNNSKKDGDWAFGQLQSDLKKYASRNYKLPKPEYYLFTTNVSLSGVARTGSRDRVNSLLKKYQSKLGLKGYHVWDNNDIRSFLDGDLELRSAYGHFITAGDVLLKMAKILNLQDINFLEVMHSFLQKELIADMSAKLQSAGDDPDVQIPLANVFIDLPFAESSEAATLAKQEDEKKAPMVVERLLAAGSLVLRQTTSDEAFDFNDNKTKIHPKLSRFVIVGGPGQGKSTVGQYFCQLYRAAILKDRPIRSLDIRISGIIRQLENQQEVLGGLPIIRRFPIRIELKSFANILANEQEVTILEYIRREISRLGNAEIKANDLKLWMTQYPWLLVLDGLDEVPPSSNRSDVMKQVEYFRIDVASLNVDILIVATTRPQSYSKEFGDDIYRHFYLIPMYPKHAMEYGRRLAEARCGGDDHRKEELIRSLEKACKNKATSRLMQSPLQVTIMATLLEETGEPPQQRYRLFAEYYRTIYRRETRRRLLGGILSERQTDIDTIHAQTGLLLHLSGERVIVRSQEKITEDVESALSDHQFRELVRARLEKIKVPPAQATTLLNRMTDGSLQRLVFLVRPREGWIRFDITSLKEFMAAEAIMTGADNEVRKRLEATAPAMYWRNVFLFAIGRCFVQHEHMLDSVVGICTDLNEVGAAERILNDYVAGHVAKATLWGSRLALDILMDGTARQYPEYEVRLAKLALELVKICNVETAARLASVYNEDLASMYREVLEDRFGKASFWEKLGAWYLILGLANRSIKWAEEWVERSWPIDGEQQMVLLNSQDQTLRRKWWWLRLQETAPKVSPSWIRRYFYEYSQSVKNSSVGPQPRLVILKKILEDYRGMKITNRSKSFLADTLGLTPIQLDPIIAEELLKEKFENPHWFPILSGVRFSQEPNALRLAQELEWLAKNIEPEKEHWFGQIPWPLEACLVSARSKDDLMAMAKSANAGLFGDIQDWKQAERRWNLFGVTDEDLNYITNDYFPFDKEIGRIGFPILSASLYNREQLVVSQLSNMMDKLHTDERNLKDAMFAFNLAVNFAQDTKGKEAWLTLSLKNQQDLFLISSYLPNCFNFWSTWIWLTLFSYTIENREIDCEMIDYLNWLGLQDVQFRSPHKPINNWDDLVFHFCVDPFGKIGLLTFILLNVESGKKHAIPYEILEKISNSGHKLKSLAELLMIGVDELSEKKMTEIVIKLTKLPSPYLGIRKAINIAATVSSKRKATIAMAIINNMPLDLRNRVLAIEDLRNELVEFLMMRPSNLNPDEFLSDPRILERS